jgi:hypothetical protein
MIFEWSNQRYTGGRQRYDSLAQYVRARTGLAVPITHATHICVVGQYRSTIDILGLYQTVINVVGEHNDGC